MNLKKLFNIRNAIIVPIALFVLLFGARCTDNNDNFNDELLTMLLNCPGGAMGFMSGSVRTWDCCRAIDHFTYWEVLGSGGSEAVRLFFGKDTPLPQTYNDDALTSNHEYIQFVTGGIEFLGVKTYNALANSSITITIDNSTTIVGSFDGDVYNSTGLLSHSITGGAFVAVK